MTTTHMCDCSQGNDMTCPADQPLANLITRLTKAGYRKEVHVVDAMWAKSLLVECSNCGSRGGFDALGSARTRVSGPSGSAAPAPTGPRCEGSACGGLAELDHLCGKGSSLLKLRGRLRGSRCREGRRV